MIELGKYGLTGNTGLTGEKEGVFHIASNYDSNGMVFVEKSIDEWVRMTLAKAEEKGLKIIKCCKCDKPAVSLSHYHPYDNETTVCAEHWEKRNE